MRMCKFPLGIKAISNKTKMYLTNILTTAGKVTDKIRHEINVESIQLGSSECIS